MASFEEMAADNPNIRSQYDEWREARSANGEDPWTGEPSAIT